MTRILTTLALLALTALAGVVAQPTLPTLPRVGPLTQQPVGWGVGQQQALGAYPGQAVPIGAQQPIMAGGVFPGQQPIVGAYPQQGLGYPGFGTGIPQQPALGAFGGVQQPIMTQPIMQQPIVQQQPWNLNQLQTATLPQQFGSGIMGPVLPQDFGSPSAMYGTLQQPIISAQQAQQLLPMTQLQAALNQRVAGFGQVQPLTAPITNMPAVGNIAFNPITV